MHVRFVLISITRGDELMPSQRKVEADSHDRRTLELLRDERARVRKQWLATHAVHPCAAYTVIDHEEIQEVASL